MKSSFLVPCVLAFIAMSACADEDVATIAAEHPTPPSNDAGADTSAPGVDGATGDAADGGSDGASNEGASGDGAQAEASSDAEAGSTSDAGSDGARRDGGPGGDGGLVIGSDGAAKDASFQIKNPSGTNLLSFSDIRADCNAVNGATAGTFVMTCEEKTGTSAATYWSAVGPCRTVKVTFATNPTTGPTTGLTLAVVAKTAPAQGEAFVVYQESIDCTAANTNGWSVAQTGGTLKVDTRGDTGMNFTLANVPMGPSSAAGVVNQNAAGTFTLAGTGFSRLPFGIK
jgi:hypothetical protein